MHRFQSSSKWQAPQRLHHTGHGKAPSHLRCYQGRPDTVRHHRRPKKGCIYYLEEQPAENGRGYIVAYFNGKIQDVLPKEYNARTRVHEYGGTTMAIGSDCKVIFTDVNTLGVFVLDYEAETGNVQVTPLVEANAKLLFADFDMHPINNRWILAVREDHRDGDELRRSRMRLLSSMRRARRAGSSSLGPISTRTRSPVRMAPKLAGCSGTTLIWHGLVRC